MLTVRSLTSKMTLAYVNLLVVVLIVMAATGHVTSNPNNPSVVATELTEDVRESRGRPLIVQYITADSKPSDCNSLKTEVQQLKSELSDMKLDLHDLKTSLRHTNTELETTKTRLHTTEMELSKTTSRLQNTSTEFLNSSNDLNRRYTVLQTELGDMTTALQKTQTTLQTTKREFENSMNSLQSTWTNFTDKARVSVGFFVKKGKDNVPVTKGAAVLFDGVVSNVGDSYDATTGYFTTPVAGIYAFQVSCMAVPNTSYAVSVMARGAVVTQCWSHSVGTSELGSATTLVSLRPGDQVWIKSEHSQTVRGGFWHTFGGHLVHVDL